MTRLLQSAWMLCAAFAICLLPATNERLPCSTRPWVMTLVLLGFLVWIVDRLLFSRRGLQSTRSWWMLVIGLLVYGWLIAFVPSAMVDEASGSLYALDAERGQAFGSMEQGRSMRAMTFVSLTMMLLLMTADLACERIGRLVLASAITMSGTLAAVAGLWMQTNADRVAFWHVPHAPVSVFGLFWYHGNAASYLNLAWPLGVWLMIGVLRARMRHAARHVLVSVIAGALIMQIVAVFVNVSKMGHALALMEMLLLALALYLVHWRHHGGGLRRIVLMGLAVLAGVVLCAWFLGGAQGASRWHVFSARGFDDPARRHAALMALRIGNDAGWTGAGPGTFEVVSPHYAALDTVTAPGWWRHAHCDYAQFFAEWGWMGCLVLLFGIGMPLRRMFTQWRDALRTDADKSLSCHRRTGLACVSVAVISLLLHALVDFPFQIMALQNLAVVMAALLGGLSETSSKRGGRLMAR